MARRATGIGSQMQQPLACVIVGGMLLSPICNLLVIPVLARLWMPTIGKSGLDAPGPQSSAATSA
jgi:heavy metal efflux system protein